MRLGLLALGRCSLSVLSLLALFTPVLHAEEGITMEFRVHQADRNQDKQLSFEEFIELRRPYLQSQFRKLDRNSDGALSEKELFPNKSSAKALSSRRATKAARDENWARKRFLRDGHLGSDSD